MPPAPEIPGAAGFVFASVWSRLAAYLLDSILVLALILVAVIAVSIVVPEPGIVTTVILFAVNAAYFVGFWRTRQRGTPGMRLLKIQVGHAFDGAVLTLDQTLRRWVALTGPGLLLPVLPDAAPGLAFLWSLVLLLSTAASATKRGLHDLFAGSVVAAPVGQRAGAAAVVIVVVVGILIILPLASIVALVFVGGQISTILNDLGNALSSPGP